MNPGYKTSEFWLSLVASVVGILASVGIISPDQANTVVTSVSQVIGGVLAIWSVIQYVRSRTALKAAMAGIGGLKQ